MSRILRQLQKPRCRCLLRPTVVYAGGRPWCWKCYLRGLL
jgi:hypothetical protein